MRFRLALSLFASILSAQTAAPKLSPAAEARKNTPPETVVATVNGRKYTAAEVEKMVNGTNPQLQQAFAAKPVDALRFLLMSQYLAHLAEQEKLDQESPYKEILEFNRNSVLSQAELNNKRNRMAVSEEDQKAYYAAHGDKYQNAKVRVIYISYVTAPATDKKKARTEGQAKERAEQLSKQAQAGADFAKLAKENSDDADSAAKGGDFGQVSRASEYPQAVKDAIFQLKAGQVSAPLKQPNGFYIFKVDEMSTEPFEKVYLAIQEEINQERFNSFIREIEKKYDVKVENPAYFTAEAPAGGAGARSSAPAH